MKRLKQHILLLGSVLILTIIFGTIFVVSQQFQRHDANQPQIQYAEDAAAKLAQGAKPQEVYLGKVDMNHSLAPFINVYDKNGKPVAGSGYLNGSLPDIPIGVLTASDGRDYHHVTWQPQPDVRFAAVVVRGGDYYAVSGRSLHEVERNVDQSLQLVAFGYFSSLLVLAVIVVIVYNKH